MLSQAAIASDARATFEALTGVQDTILTSK